MAGFRRGGYKAREERKDEEEIDCFLCLLDGQVNMTGCILSVS